MSTITQAFTTPTAIGSSCRSRASDRRPAPWHGTPFSLPRGITHSEEGASEQPLRGVFLEFKEPQPLGTVEQRTSPPAFPGTSGRQLRDSDRVTIWELAPRLGPSRPPHLHARDAVIVTFTKLKPRVTFVERGTVHNDEQTSGADRVFAFEVK
jgi:hypothetical protein